MAKITRVAAARKWTGLCETCHEGVRIGDSYKWIAPRGRGDSKPGKKRIRCSGCDDWHEWEYNPSVRCQCDRVAHDTRHQLEYTRSYETPAQAERIMKDAGLEVRGHAVDRGVSAQRATWAFGHENRIALKLKAENMALNRWAKEFSYWRAPRLPEPERAECTLCVTKGMDVSFGGASDCPECQGEGIYIPDGPTEDQLDDWRVEVLESAMPILEGNPL